MQHVRAASPAQERMSHDLSSLFEAVYAERPILRTLIAQHELLPSACKIVRQSANHSALALPAATAPERILLPLHYRGLTKLSQQRNVAFVRTSQSECNAQSTARSATQLPVQQAAT